MAHVPDDIPLATWIRQLIDQQAIYKFYKSEEWIRLRDEVMRDSHNECQHCLQNGIYRRAEMVHHVNEVRKRPDLALTREFVDVITGEKITNLIALCNPCHERVHDRCGNFREQNGNARFRNEERW